MNKPILYGGIASGIVIVIMAIVVISMSSTLSLEQIVEKKDCKALAQWDQEHMFDDDIQIEKELYDKAVNLSLECAGKLLDNMLSDNTKPVEAVTSEYIEQIAIVNDMIQNKNCGGIKDWKKQHGNGEKFGFSGEEMGKMLSYRMYCDNVATINDEGFDTSDRFSGYSDIMP